MNKKNNCAWSGIFLSAITFLGCGGGNTPAGATGTCESICAKSTALNCSADVSMGDCVSSCVTQRSNCEMHSGATTFQTYLDCVENTRMECGSISNTSSSPDCVSEGLATFACQTGTDGGMIDGGGTDSGGGGSITTGCQRGMADATCSAMSKPPHHYLCSGAGGAAPTSGCEIYFDYGADTVAWCCP